MNLSSAVKNEVEATELHHIHCRQSGLHMHDELGLKEALARDVVLIEAVVLEVELRYERVEACRVDADVNVRRTRVNRLPDERVVTRTQAAEAVAATGVSADTPAEAQAACRKHDGVAGVILVVVAPLGIRNPDVQRSVRQGCTVGGEDLTANADGIAGHALGDEV